MKGTILLTSQGMRVKDEILKLLPNKPEETKILHVNTAAKPKSDPQYMYKDLKLMEEAGFQVIDIDIEKKTAEELRRQAKDVDVIYMQGGEGYYLLRAVLATGFDKIIKEFLDRGGLYIGVSAGSYIVCPSMEMHTWKRKDGERDKYGMRDDQALGFVSFLVTVHYKPEFREDVKAGIQKSNYKVYAITDDQAILYKDGQAKLVGQGESVNI